MPYLVDGSNLGGVLGGAAGARDPASVVAALLPWARERGAVLLLFDGPPRPEVAAAYGALKVEWSGARSADDAIVARLGADPRVAVSAWIVVTADRALARRCRALGARVESASAFARRIARPRPAAPRRATARAAESAAGKPAPHADEREHWRQVFLTTKPRHENED